MSHIGAERTYQTKTVAMDSPTRILIPALRGGASFSVVTKKRMYVFLWMPPVLDPTEDQGDQEGYPEDPENVWTIVHRPVENDRGDRPWTARCHPKVAWLTALRCFAEGVTEACGLDGRYVGYYDRSMAAGTIQKAWRKHSARARAPAILAKARMVQELRLLPPGGPTGTFDAFAGGSVYKALENAWTTWTM